MSESEGAGRTIPDGDYWIVNALSERYTVDIPGDNFNTKNGTNLGMYLCTSTNSFGKYDVFTVKYLNNGYYSLTQRTTNMTINVKGKSLFSGSNVHMWEKNNSEAAQWSIRRTDKGYTLQARCNGFYLDVEGGKTDNCNLQVYEGNGTKSQKFSFIPYDSEQSIKDGVYRIGTINGMGAYIDAAGEPKEYKNGSNVQIWDAGADNYFRFEYCKNGFYKIYDNVSGLALDVNNPSDDDYLNCGANVQLYKSKDAAGQYWAIRSAGEGYYYIISKLNGYYLDLDNGKTTNGTNIHTWSGAGNTQKWSFVTNKGLSVIAPSKSIYYVGDKLDTTGMSVKMTYSDGYSIDVTKNVKLFYDMSIAGTQNVIVTYEQGGLKNTTDFVITIKDKEVTTPTISTTTTTTTTTITSTTTTILITTTALTNTPSSTTTTIPTTNPKPLGDVNGDNKISVADVILLQRYLVKKVEFTNEQWKLADLNNDGTVNVFDMIILKRRILKG